MNIFYIQLLTSFIVGGGVITAISFVVERIDKKYAGLILGSPTTLVLGLFFLGATVGSHKVANVIPAVFLPLGISIFFSVIYLYAALFVGRYKLPKLGEIIATYLISISCWFVFIAPIVLTKFSNLFAGIIGCLALIGLTQYIFVQFPQKDAHPRVITYTVLQKIGRGMFIGFVIATIVYLGKTLGSFWGGVFSVFPAAFSSTLPIFHWYNKPKDLYPFVKTVPYGALSVFVYLLTSFFTFAVLGHVWGTVASYIISIIFLVLISGRKKPL